MLSLFEMSLGIQVLVNQLPAEAEGEGTADAIAKAGNTALTGMDLDGKLPAPLGRHRPLHVLGHARYETAVIVELLGAVGDLDAVVFADDLVVSALVDILKPTPAADVVNQDMAEVSAPGLDVVDHFDEACAALDRQAAAPFVEIGPNDRGLLFQRVGRDRSGLVRDRVALQVGRHAHILRGPKRSDALRQIRSLAHDKRIGHQPMSSWHRYLSRMSS